jgi:hypothetical protein
MALRQKKLYRRVAFEYQRSNHVNVSSPPQGSHAFIRRSKFFFHDRKIWRVLFRGGLYGKRLPNVEQTVLIKLENNNQKFQQSRRPHT